MTCAGYIYLLQLMINCGEGVGVFVAGLLGRVGDENC